MNESPFADWDRSPFTSEADEFHSQIVGDDPSQVDQLGFDPHVASLAEFLTDPTTQPPLTVSVEGVWGSGKTSFMRQLEAKIDDEHPVVWFNPWRHENTNELGAAFMLAFLRSIREGLSWRRRATGYGRLLLRRLNESRVRRDLAWKGLIGAVLAVIGAVALGALGLVDQLTLAQLQTVGLLGAGGGLLGVLVWTQRSLDRTESQLRAYIDDPGYADRVPFIQRFHDDLEDILDSYVADRRVFVFIDDIDRCAVPRAAELMQAINLMVADDSRLVFVIGMDREKVAAGIAAKHQDTLDFLPDAEYEEGHEFGSDYLEKFIDIPFAVPRPDKTDIERFIERFIRETLDADSPIDSAEASEEVAQWNRDLLYELTVLVAPYLEYNPRRIKKFLNLYRLQVHLANSYDLLEWQANGALTLQQIGKFVAVTVQWPSITDALAADGDLFHDLVAAVEAPDSVADPSPEFTDWQQQDGLSELLRAVPDEPDAERSKYDLSTADVTALLEISPPMRTDWDTQMAASSS